MLLNCTRCCVQSLNRMVYALLTVLVLGYAVLCTPQVHAAIYYVSNTGNDSNPGTVASPVRTIMKGVSKLKPGDFLYVRGGTYVESVFVGQSGTKDQPITIEAYPGELPVIDGEDKLPATDGGDLVLIVGDYVRFKGFEVRNSNITGTRLGGGGVMLEGEHTLASHLKVHHIWEHGIIAKGNYSVVEFCQVWQCAFSNSIKPGSPVAGYWSTGISAARSPVDGITRNAVLRGNISYNNWGEGISTFEADGTLIEDNVSYDNWSVNLYVSDTRNALVQRNIVYNTPNNVVRQRRPLTLGDELAGKPRSANNTVINNFLYNADFWAFWSTGVPGSGLDNVLIAHNTIVNGQLEIGASPEDQAVNKSAFICNNIFYNEQGNPWEVMGPLTNLTFSNNLWSSLPPQGLRGPGDIAGDPRIGRQGSVAPGELKADYFRLLADSPAINKGIAVTGVPADFFGKTRDAHPDMGGHEYQIPDGMHLPDGAYHLPSVTLSGSELNIRFAPDNPCRILMVYNTAGRLVLRAALQDNKYTADISSWIRGIYIVVLQSDLRQEEVKVLVM